MFNKVLRFLVPDCEFVAIGQPTSEAQYKKNVTWLDSRTQPTWAEIQAATNDVAKAEANREAEQSRADAYRAESDPLFFGWQRGENTEQEWLDKVAEIRARHPYA